LKGDNALEIKKYVFHQVKLYNRLVKAGITYQVIRSEENENEVHVIYFAEHTKVRNKVLKFMTEKTDEEIIEHFDKKFMEYETQIQRATFFGGLKPAIKFIIEFQSYFRLNN
jgi:hypothetical protein